jgi:uncharacterized membrane-anchored protein
MNPVAGKKGIRFSKALPLLAAALIPFSVLGASRSGSGYIMEDEVNSGSQNFQSGNNFNLSGVVGNSGARVVSETDSQMVSWASDDAPKTISDLKISSDTDRSLKLTWSAPSVPSSSGSSVEGYEIRYSSLVILDDFNFFRDGTLNGGSTSIPVEAPGQEQNYIVDGLKYNTSYYVSIISSFTNSTGINNTSLVGQGKVYDGLKWEVNPFWTLASTPSTLTPTFLPGGVQLTFQPNNPDHHTLAYEVVLALDNDVTHEINRVSGSYSDESEVVVPFTKDKQDDNLNLNRDYYFFVRVKGGGEWTDWVSAPLDYVDVDWRTTLSVVQVSSTSIGLRWSPPTGGGDYDLVADTDVSFDGSSGNLVFVPGITSGSDVGTIPGLKANTTYYLKVVENGNSFSDSSPYIATVTTLGPPVFLGVELFPGDKKSAKITWKDPADMTLGDHSYIVRVSSVDASFSILDNYQELSAPYSPSGNNFEAFFNGTLLGNTTHYVQIIGVNRAGVQSVGPDIYSPSDPAFYTLPAEPQNVMFTSLGDGLTPENHVAIQWEHGTNNPSFTKYEVEITTTAQDWTPTSLHTSFTTDPGATSTTTFVSLANQEYFARVRAIAGESGADPSSWNESTPPTFTAVLSPIGLSVVGETTDTLILQWQRDDNLGGNTYSNSMDTEYAVSWTTDETFGSSETFSSVLDNSNVVLGVVPYGTLNPNTTYYAAVKAIKKNGSTWADVEERTNGVTLALPPGGVVFETYTTSASVKWTVATDTKYHVKLNDEENDSLPEFNESNLTSGEVQIKPLSPNTTYFLQVRSINKGGKTNDSSGWRDYGPKATDAAAPVGVSTEVAGSPTMAIVVRWSNNDNAVGTDYRLLAGVSPDVNAAVECGTAVGTTGGVDEVSAECRNLTPNLVYNIWVKAVGHKGPVLSNSVSGRTSAVDLGGVSWSSAGDATSQVKVEWVDTVNAKGTEYRVEIATSTGFYDGTGKETQSQAFTKADSSSMSLEFGGQSSLIPNREYFGRVGVVGEGGVISWEQIQRSTYTHPVEPTDLVPVAVDTGQEMNKVKFEWGHGTNWVAGTKYELVLTTGTGVGRHEVKRVETDFGVTDYEFDESQGVVWANANYDVSVKAVAADGDSSHDSAVVSASTWTAVLGPQGVGMAGAMDNDITAAWVGTTTVGGVEIRNRPGTEYVVKWGTSSGDYGSNSVTVSGDGPLFSKSLKDAAGSDLTPNTAYYAEVTAKAAAVVGGWGDEHSIEVVGVTLATVPVAGGYTLHKESGTVVWTANGNPVDTEYVVKMSSYSDFQSSMDPANYVKGVHSATFTALTPNTTYWVRAWGKNRVGVVTTDPVEWDPQPTDAAAADLADVVAVGDGTSAFDISWSANGNPSGTTYRVLVATGPDFKGQRVGMEETTAVMLSTSNWIPNTTYHVRVDAVGYNTQVFSSNVKVHRTLAVNIGGAGLSLRPKGGAEHNRVVLKWDRSGNSEETEYEVELSTGSGFEDNPLNKRTAPNAEEYEFETDLDSNREYFGRVRAVGGVWSGASASTYTWPVQAVGLKPKAVSGGNETSGVAYEWGHGTNWASGTKYELVLTTGTGSDTHEVVRKTTNFGATGCDFGAANGVRWANAEYTVSVRAVAEDGIHHSGEVTSSTWTAVLVAQGVGMGGANYNDITAAWVGTTTVGGVEIRNRPGTEYVVKWGTSSGDYGSNSVTVSGDGPLFSKSLKDAAGSDLTPNTAYYAEVTAKAAAVVGGWGDEHSIEVVGVTLATVPVAGGYTLHKESGTVVWTANGNPVDTEYVVKMSSYSDFQSSMDPANYVKGVHSATFTALTPNTTYWVRAWGKNRVGVVTTDPVEWDPQPTDAAAADLADVVAVGDGTSAFDISWSANGNPSGTTYRVLVATGPDFKGQRVGMEETTAVMLSTSNWIPNTTYHVRVDAVGYNTQVFSSNVKVHRTLAVNIGGAGLSLRPKGGAEHNRVVLKWDRSGNSEETEYEVELSTGSGFEDNPLNKRTAPNAEEYEFETDLDSNREYFGRVRAVGGVWSGASASTYTSPVQPQSLRPKAVASGDKTSHVAYEWGHGTNWVAGTKYELVLTTGTGVGRHEVKRVETDFGVTDYEFDESQGVVWANANYDVSVKAVAADGDSSHDSAVVSASTWTAVLGPQGVGMAGAMDNDITAAWVGTTTVGGVEIRNRPGTEYVVKWGTSSGDYGSNSVTVSGDGPLFSKSLKDAAGSDLTPNTAYYAEVTAKAAAVVGGWGDEHSIEVVGVTLATVPVAGGYTLHKESGTVVWTANGNPVDTEYVVKMSSYSDFQSSMDPANYVKGVHSATFTALTPNTTYWVRAWGKNRVGVVTTDPVEWDPQPTDAAAADLADVVAVGDGTSAFDISWSANGNPSGTTYRVLVATGPDFKGQRVGMEETTAVMLSTSNWIPNTTYHVRVDAVGYNTQVFSSNVKVHRTLAVNIGGAGLSLRPKGGAEHNRVVLKWDRSGNSEETEYEVELSTGSGFEDNPLNKRTAPNAEEYEFETDLDSNREYFGRVRAVGGVWSGASASTYTWPVQAVGLKPKAVSGGNETSGVAYEWGHGTNWASGTKYELVLTTGTGSDTHEVVRKTTNFGATGCDFGAANGVRWANAEYTVSVRAVAEDGIHHSGEVTSSTWTAVLVAQGVGMGGANYNDITAVWVGTTTVGGVEIRNRPGTEYVVKWGTSSGDYGSNSVTVSGDGPLFSKSLKDAAGSDLTPNTAYYAEVTAKAAAVVGGWGDEHSIEVVGVTLATVPVAGGYTLHKESGTVVWTANGNPVDTEYVVKMSSYSDFQSSMDPANYVKGVHSATFTALTPNTTYWVRAWGKNRVGVVTTDPVEWDPQPTDAAAADLADVVAVGDGTSAFDISWSANGNPSGTTYRVLVATGPDFKGQRVGMEETTAVMLSTSNWIPNTTYHVRVDAVGYNTQVFSSNVKVHRTLAVNIGGAGLSLRPKGGAEHNRVVLKWDRSGNSEETEYEVELSTGSGFEDNPLNKRTAPNAEEYEFETDLDSNREYFGRVRAVGGVWSGASASTYTSPVQPQSLRPKAVASGDKTSHVAYEWGHGTNWASGTKYELVLTTGTGSDTHEVVRKTTNFGATGCDFGAANGVRWANAEYTVSVRAVAEDGIHHSGEVTSSTWTAVLVAQGVGMGGANYNDITAVWVGTTTVGGVEIRNRPGTEYVVKWGTSSGDYGSNSVTVSGDGPLFSKSLKDAAGSDLTPNTAYYAEVTAKAAAVVGGWGDEHSIEVVGVTLATVPVAGGYTLHKESGTVVWTANGNPVDTEYVVKMSSYSDFQSSMDPANYVKGVHSATFTALTPNTTYWVRAWGKNRVGVVTTDPVEWDPQPTDAAAVEITSFSLFTDSGTVRWNPKGNPEGTRYSVCVAADEMFTIGRKCDDNLIQDAGDTNAKTHRVTGLTPNQPYYAKVEAHGHNGTVVVSDVSNEAETASADVESISLEPLGDQTRELKLTWDKKGNSARTKYAVELTTNTTGPWTSYPLVTDVSEYRFTGLISNQQYIARVKVEGGNYSREQTNYTWPSAVVNLSSAAVGNGTHEVKFEWDPGNNAEATIYEVLLSTENGGNRREFPVRETVRGARSIVFGALEGVVWANEKYEVKVWVKPDNGNLTAPVQTASAWTEPLAVGSLVFPVISSHSIQAQWGEPVSMVNSVAVVNAPGTGYTLEWSTREGELQSWKSLAGGQGGYSEWLEPGAALTPDTTYYVDVRTKRRDNGVSTTFTRQAVVTNVSKPVLGRLDISPSTRSSVIRWERNSNPLDTMYEVTVYDGKKPMPPVIVRTTHTIVGGLTPAKAYEFTVTAVGRGITPSRESSETVQKTTLPEPPLVEKINKSTVAGDKQQLEVEWSKGANDLIGAYVARIYLVGSGTLPNYESSVSPAVFSGLDPNREYVVQIRSQNAVGDYSVGVTTPTYTLPAVPGAPQATTILSNFQLGISFENQTQNPATTEYAVRLRAVSSFSGTPDVSAGKYAVLPGTEGKTTFISDDPVWGRRSEWLGGSKLILTRLPDTFGYEVVLYARNDLKEEVGPGVGMAIAQSAGVPTVKLTLPTGEDLTHLDSLNKAIYYNGTTVPFTASGSSHFNVLWSSRTRTIENNDMDQTYGWNGLLNVREDVVKADEDKFSKNDKAVGGFAVREEGEYFLNIAGTAMVDTGSGNLDVHDVFESTSPFRVYIDTTPPVAGALEVYFSSDAARDRNQEQRISTGTMWGDPNPYVTWDPTDLLGKESSRSPVEGWTVSWSTDSAVLPSVDRPN